MCFSTTCSQHRVSDASHVVAFAKNIGTAEVDCYLDRIAKVRRVAADSLNGLREVLTGFLTQPAEVPDANGWATRQVDPLVA